MKDPAREPDQQLLELQQAEQHRIVLMRRGQIRVANENERKVDESQVRSLQQQEYSRPHN